MSNTVDNRVVSMEFDNAKFEKNVATSLETLKHLDSSLDGLVNSSKKFDGVSFEDVANQIDSLASHFTLMGRIALKVYDEIAQGIVDLGKKIISFNTEQLASGWEKYGEKTTSVQTIMSATGMSIEDVSEQLDKLNRFTDETSYSFTDMTSNIAKFTSQGIDLESAVTSMEGIATWAASAGQNAQAASRAMYNISQAMGAGSMKLIDWKSIQNANMATKEFKEQAIAAGIAEGTLIEKNGQLVTANGAVEVSIKNFDQTLQKGWFTSGTMSRVFSEYGKFADLVDQTTESTGISVSRLLQLAEAQKHSGESTKAASTYQDMFNEYLEDSEVSAEELQKAIEKLNQEEYEFSKATYKAAQEAKTFTDAVDATKDALSTAWMNVFETIFGNYEQARVIWTDIANWAYDIFAEPVNNLNDLLDNALNKEFWKKPFDEAAQKNIRDTADALLEYGEVAESVFKELGIVSDEDIKRYGSIKEAIKHVDLTADSVGNVIDNLLGGRTGAGGYKGVATLEEVKGLIHDIWRGDYGNGYERRDVLAEMGYDPEKVQAALNKMHAGFELTEEDIQGISSLSTKFTEDQIKQLTELKKRLDEGTASVKDYENVYHSLTGRELLFDKNVGALYNLMAVVKQVRKTVSDAWQNIFGESTGELIYNFIAKLQAFIMKLRNLTNENETFRKSLEIVFTVFKIGANAISAVGNAFSRVFKLFEVNSRGGVISGFVNKIHEMITGFDKWLEENEILEKAVNKIVGWFSTLKTAIEPVIEKIKNLWNSFKQSESVTKATKVLTDGFHRALNAVGPAIQTVVGWFDSLIDSFVAFYNAHVPGLIQKIQSAFENWNLNNITETIANIKSAIVDFFNILLNFIRTKDYQQFVEDLSTRFSGLADKVRELETRFIAWFSSLDEGKILTIAKLATALLSLVAAFKLIKKFTSLQTAFVGFLNSLSSSVRAFVNYTKVNQVLKIASAIAVLAASLWALSTIPSEQLRSCTVTLMMIMAAMIVLTSLVGVFANTKGALQMQGIATSISMFALGVTALVGALWVLANQIDQSKILQSLGILAIIMAMLVAVLAIMSRFNVKTSINIGGVLAFAAALLITVEVLEKLQNGSVKLTPTAFERLAEVLLAVWMISFAIRGVKLSAALGLLVFIASLSLIQDKLVELMNNLVPFSEFQSKWQEFLALLGLIFSIGLVVRTAGSGSLKAAVTIGIILAAIYLLAKEVGDIGKNFTTEELAKGTAVIDAIGLMIAAVMASISLIDAKSFKKGMAASIIAIVAAIVAIGVELLLLTVIPWENLGPAILAIGVVIGGLALVFAALGQLSKNNPKSILSTLAPMAGIFAVLWLVFNSLEELSSIANPERLVPIAVSVGIIMLALAESLNIMKDISYKNMGFKELGKMVSEMIAVLGLTTGVLYILSLLPPTEGLLVKVIGLSVLMEAMAAAMLIISKAKPEGDFIATLGLMIIVAAGMCALALAMQLLNNVEVDGLITKVVSLSALLLALSAAVLIVSFMPGPEAALTALAGLTVVMLGILEFAGVLALIGYACNEWEGFAESLSTGAEALGGALGTFVGAFIGNLLKSAVNAITDLESFATALEPVVDQFKRFDDSAIAGVKAMAGLLLALAASELAEAVNNILGGWITKLTDTSPFDKLKDFAAAVNDYVISISGLSTSQINNAAKITDAVSNLLNAISPEGGKIDWIVGNESTAMANLSGNLKEFGTAMKDFGDSISTLDPSIVSNAELLNQAMTPLADAAGKIGKEGGLLQSINGTADIASFGSKMLAFVRMIVGGMHNIGLLELAGLIDDTAISKINKIGEITDALVDAVDNIPTLGGLIADIFGDNSPTTFGNEIKEYIDSIIEIADTAVGLTDDKIEAITRSLNVITALNGIFGGASTTETGSANLESESRKLPIIGEGYKNFTNKFVSIDTEKVVANGQNLVSAASNLKNIPYDTLANSSFLPTFGQNYSIFGNGIIGLDTETMLSNSEEFKEAISLLDPSTLTSGEFDYGPIMEQFENINNIVPQATQSCQEFNTVLAENSESCYTAGVEWTTQLLEGMTQESPKIEQVASYDVGLVETTLKTAQKPAYDAGVAVGIGFAQGIIDMIPAVVAAANQMAASATREIKITIDSSSPSKVTKKLGGFFGEGFAIGIHNMTSAVESSAKDLASTATSVVSSAISIVDGIVEDDINPVITPVLDLSEVRREANSISNLGGFTASMSGISADSIATMETQLALQKNQNGSAPVTAVLSDSAVRALAATKQAPGKTVIQFTGDLAQLARILNPVIIDDTNNHGTSLIRK